MYTGRLPRYTEPSKLKVIRDAEARHEQIMSRILKTNPYLRQLTAIPEPAKASEILANLATMWSEPDVIQPSTAQSRIRRLESELQRKDQRIAELESQLKQERERMSSMASICAFYA